MIESRKKKEKLTDLVRRWCKHTQHHNLRDGDVSSLVSQVLDEFYSIKLSCGHLVRDMDEGVCIAFFDESGRVQGIYCKDCAEEYKKKLGAWEIKSEVREGLDKEKM